MFRPPSLRPHQGPHHPGHLPQHHQPHHPHPPHFHPSSHHSQDLLPISVSLLLLVGGIAWLVFLGTSSVVGWFLALLGAANLVYRKK